MPEETSRPRLVEGRRDDGRTSSASTTSCPTRPTFASLLAGAAGAYFGEVRPAATMISGGPGRSAHEDRDRGHGAHEIAAFERGAGRLVRRDASSPRHRRPSRASFAGWPRPSPSPSSSSARAARRRCGSCNRSPPECSGAMPTAVAPRTALLGTLPPLLHRHRRGGDLLWREPDLSLARAPRPVVAGRGVRPRHVRRDELHRRAALGLFRKREAARHQ